MNVINDIIQNRFVLVLLNEKQYMDRLNKIVESVERSKNKICYICLSRPYKDVLSELKKNKINTKSFFFIDVLSSHYGKLSPRKNCIFLDSPDDLKSIKKAIGAAIKKGKCSVILFDTISALLIYQENFSILKFTHSLTTESKKENVKKIFIALKDNSVLYRENKELLNDLRMFADKTVDMG
jgi:archaellum biogenesis ATPase FlaH